MFYFVIFAITLWIVDYAVFKLAAYLNRAPPRPLSLEGFAAEEPQPRRLRTRRHAIAGDEMVAELLAFRQDWLGEIAPDQQPQDDGPGQRLLSEIARRRSREPSSRGA